MGQMYEASVTKTTTAAAGHIATLLTTAATRVSVREISIYAQTAVAGEVGTGRPAAVGTGGSSAGVTGQTGDPADAAAVTILSSAFVTLQPTAPTNPMRRIWLPAVIGAGVTWIWGVGELIVPVSANLCIWQYSAAIVTYEVYAKWIE